MAPTSEPPPNQIQSLAELYSQKQFRELLKKGSSLAKKYPKAAIVQNFLGAGNAALRRTPEAIACFNKAIKVNPNYAEAYSNLGAAFWTLGKFDEAIENYRRALRAKPNLGEAHINLCELLNRLNRTTELEQALRTASRHGMAGHPLLLLLAAKLENRQENFDTALLMLDRVDPEKLSPRSRRDFYYQLGTTCDRLKLYDRAFDSFEKQNEVAAASNPDMPPRADAYLERTAELARSWHESASPDWSDYSSPSDVSLAFLVGFPRSGTTLLDTILLGHSKISVVEERQMVGKMREQFDRPMTVDTLSQLAPDEIDELRAVYFEELAKHVDPASNGNLILDKHPMNIRNIGLIHRVFPRAKIIFALRHPCDCILSCFMQNFIVSEAMYNMLTIDGSANLYDRIMDLWAAYNERLELDVFTVRYEDLVGDVRQVATNLVAFLDLEWDENLLDYQETAKARGRIDTPSFTQVVQPLYTRSSGRWLNYREHIEPSLPVLEPWIREFGYDEHGREKGNEAKEASL